MLAAALALWAAVFLLCAKSAGSKPTAERSAPIPEFAVYHRGFAAVYWYLPGDGSWVGDDWFAEKEGSWVTTCDGEYVWNSIC